MAGTSRFMSEDETDEMIQTTYARSRLIRTKGMFVWATIGIGILLGFLLPFALGVKFDPVYFPIWPLLVLLPLCLIVALAGALVFNMKVLGMTSDAHERMAYIKRGQTRSLIFLVIALVFLLLFVSIMPANSWLEGLITSKAGTHDQVVDYWNTHDYYFNPDPMAISDTSIKVEVKGNATADLFIGELEVFKKIDKENITDVEGVSLSGAYARDASKLEYDGGEFKSGILYVVRIYNYENTEAISIKLTIHREIDDGILTVMVVLSIVAVVLAGLSFGVLHSLKKRKVRAPARERAREPRAERTRDAATMFADMEDEVGEMFAGRTGFRDGGVPPAPAAGGRRPARPAGAATRPSGPSRGRPAPQRTRPAAPPPIRPPVEEVEVAPAQPKGEMKTIACPRCKTRFSYMKMEGQVTEIKCPKCGKRGRVGAKKAAAAAAAAATAAAKRPARPSPAPTPTPRPAPKPRPALSPLEEITGGDISAGGPPTAAAAPAKKKTLACPKCKRKFTIEERPRPFKIKCPHCGKEGMLK